MPISSLLITGTQQFQYYKSLKKKNRVSNECNQPQGCNITKRLIFFVAGSNVILSFSCESAFLDPSLMRKTSFMFYSKARPRSLSSCTLRKTIVEIIQNAVLMIESCFFYSNKAGHRVPHRFAYNLILYYVCSSFMRNTMAKTILFFKDLVFVFAFYGLMRKYNRR